MVNKKILGVLSCFVLLFVCPRAHGQVTGSFLGTVTDKTGSPITGATVRVTSQATGVSRETKTDDTGHYVLNLLPVSIYTIHVEFQGFQPVETKDVKLQVDEQRELDFSLAPATVSASVEVVASAVAVETANASLGQVITSQEVAQLPLNGRDFVQLATLTPGTTQETSNGSFFNNNASSEIAARGPFSLSVGGSRANSTDWLIDGVDNNELTSGGISILSSIDSIQEFKVLTYDYSAEYGTRAGPTVLLTTKSGTNDFHGTLYEFLRNTSLDAKSFFATSTEKFNLNQYGGAIGGPIRKNKTFFFIDGEQKDQRHGTTFSGLVPTDAMRKGDYTFNALGQLNPISTIDNPYTSMPFQCDASGNPVTPNANGSQTPVAGGAACNKIPTQFFTDPGGSPTIGAKLIALYPEPTPGYNVNGNNYITEPVRRLDETKFDIRLDNNFSGADSVFARFSYDQAVSYVPGGSPPPAFAEPNAFGSNQGIINHARNVAIGETHVFSPTTVNQFNFGYNRIFDYITSQGTGSCESSKLGIPGANLGCGPLGGTTCKGSSCGLTSILVIGYWSLGDRGYSPFTGGTNVFAINDTFDMIRGKHDIKVGGGIRINQMNVRAEGFQDGFWVEFGGATANFPAGVFGDASANILTGFADSFTHDQNFNGDVTGRRWKLFRPFVQDDWRFSRNLTLNLGLAWAIATPISEAGNRMADFIPSATGYQWLIPGNGCTTALQPCTRAGSGAGIQLDWSALEPRIGLAWKVRGSDKTVVRAGYAIYHDSAWSMGAQGLWQNPPFAAESNGGATTFAAGFPIITPPATPTNFKGAFNTENTNLKLGMVQQFNVNVERQLPGQIVLTAGYAGSRSDHTLNFGNNINTGAPTACAGGPTPVAGYTLGCAPGGAYFPPPFLSQPFKASNIYSINDYGRSHYNSLELKAETKSTKYGLYALVGYTYSRTYDSGYSDGLSTPIGAPDFPLPNWGKLDWALSQINLNNSFTASVIYDLPFGRGKKFGHDWNNATNTLLGGWQVTLIEKITSGFPIFIIDTANNSGANLLNIGTAFPASRVDQIANPFTPGIVASNPNPQCQKLVSNGGMAPSSLGKSSGYYFNPCAFAAPPTGELGTTSRTPISGPDFVNTDFSVIKRFALPRENMGLDFRTEFFNLFNHPQFDTPSAFGGGTGADINAPSQFGRLGKTVNNPRVIQFGLKLTF
jgi:Carboxypeptidase regulatory-like domain